MMMVILVIIVMMMVIRMIPMANLCPSWVNIRGASWGLWIGFVIGNRQPNIINMMMMVIMIQYYHDVKFT